jgi:hypothetical protein
MKPTQKKSPKFTQKFHSELASPEKTRKPSKRSSLKTLTLHPLSQNQNRESLENKDFYLNSRIKIFRTHTITEASNSGSSGNICRMNLKTQRRVESLDFLVNKCSDAQFGFDNFEVLKGVKRISQDYGKLKKTVEKFQDDNPEEHVSSGINFKGHQARKMKSFMRYDGKLKMKQTSGWKYKVNTFTRCTSKATASVGLEINRKNGFF